MLKWGADHKKCMYYAFLGFICTLLCIAAAYVIEYSPWLKQNFFEEFGFAFVGFWGLVLVTLGLLLVTLLYGLAGIISSLIAFDIKGLAYCLGSLILIFFAVIISLFVTYDLIFKYLHFGRLSDLFLS